MRRRENSAEQRAFVMIAFNHFTIDPPSMLRGGQWRLRRDGQERR